MKTNAGQDLHAQALGDPASDAGAATNVTPTSLSDSGKAWAVNAWAGKQVVLGNVIGVVLTNTATVLTIDRWSTPGNLGGGAAATPAAGAYVIAPGNAPGVAVALSTNAAAPAATDVTLAGELNNAGGGLNRGVGIFGHTAGVNGYTLSRGFTMNGNDGASAQVQKVAIVNSVVPGVGRILFETSVPTPPNLVPGDQLTATDTVTT